MKIDWKYALGEIVIVIIGISIAFSLNNWAESRGDRKAATQYLTHLYRDLQEDTKSLDENIVKLEACLKSINAIVPHLRQVLPGRDTVYRKIFTLAIPVNFFPKDATYQTLVNSGDFKLIDDFHLKSTIEEQYGFYKILAKEYDRQDGFNAKYMGDFFIHQLDYDALYRGNLDFMDNPLLRNIIQSLRGVYMLKLNVSKKARDRAEALQAKIETFLTDELKLPEPHTLLDAEH